MVGIRRVKKRFRICFLRERDSVRRLAVPNRHLESKAGGVSFAEVARGWAGDEECRRLELGWNAAVVRIRRCSGHPTLIEDAVMPAALFPRLPAGVRDLHILAIARLNGVALGEAEETAGVTLARHEDGEALGVRPGMPIVEFDRVVRTCDGQPAEWRIVRRQLQGARDYAD